MDVSSCNSIPDPIASPLRIIEELHSSSLEANAKIIAKKVTPAPKKAPAKNIAKLLIFYLLLFP